MIATEREDIASAYIQRIRELVTGKRRMEMVEYPERGEEIHLSDCVSPCLAQVLYRKSLGDSAPESSDLSVLQFLRGRVVERSMAKELPAQTYDGVMFTLDDYNEAFNLYVEIKSTVSDMGKFSIDNIFPWWKDRMLGYCKALGVKEMALVVYFVVGDMWTKKKIKCGMKAWVLEFTDEEINDNWNKVCAARDELLESLKTKEPLSPLSVLNPPKWMCQNCEFLATCQYTSVKTP